MALPKFDEKAAVMENQRVQGDVWSMTLRCASVAGAAEAGQFIQLRVPAQMLLLRRPFGVAGADAAAGTIAVYYRVLGQGTRALTALRAGDAADCLGPLGRGFDMRAKRPLLVGGGMGLAPLLFLAARFGGAADVLLGGRNRGEVFWEALFAPFARASFVTTDDGSAGRRGFVTALLPELLAAGGYDCVYTCGPDVMMRGVAKLAAAHGVPCQVSLEKRMACGLGACLSCALDAADGARKKVCRDGPVFWARDVFFDD